MLDGLIKSRVELSQWVSSFRPSVRAGEGSGFMGQVGREMHEKICF